jgi:hypothetical protein
LTGLRGESLATLHELCETAEALGIAGREDSALESEIRAHVAEHDPALAGAPLGEICDVVRRRFASSQFGTLDALPPEVIARIMEEPGALRLGAASPELQKIQMGVIEGHRSRCRRAAAPLPMEARCVDERPDIDCLRACSALFSDDPRLAFEAVLRGALALAGVDVGATGAGTARAAGSAPRLLLLRPTRALPEPLRLWEWPLAFEYIAAASTQSLLLPPLSTDNVRFELKADSSRFSTSMDIYVGLRSSSDFSWNVGVTVRIEPRWVENMSGEYALWQDVADHIWDSVRTMAGALPRETPLKIHIWLLGIMHIQYDAALFGDLNAWLSGVDAIFPSPFPYKDGVSVRVRADDGRYGTLILEDVKSVKQLKALVTKVFAEKHQKASYHTTSTANPYYGIVDCALRFDLPYHLRVAEILDR